MSKKAIILLKGNRKRGPFSAEANLWSKGVEDGTTTLSLEIITKKGEKLLSSYPAVAVTEVSPEALPKLVNDIVDCLLTALVNYKETIE